MPRNHTSFEERFWSTVDRSGDGCWEWQRSFGTDGYGQLTRYNQRLSAHRVAWMFINGEIPEGVCVLHNCDNRKCCRPSHLFLGTKADNVRDMIEKGRARYTPLRGEMNGHAILTEADVRFIRDNPQIPGTVIARQLGVQQVTVSAARRRHTWRHIP